MSHGIWTSVQTSDSFRREHAQRGIHRRTDGREADAQKSLAAAHELVVNLSRLKPQVGDAFRNIFALFHLRDRDKVEVAVGECRPGVFRWRAAIMEERCL